MRLPLALWASTFLVLAACQSTNPLTDCTATSECGAGLQCLFPVGSCSAGGLCLDPAKVGGTCGAVSSYCGCNGQSVQGTCSSTYAQGLTIGLASPCGPPVTVAPGTSLTTLAQQLNSEPQYLTLAGDTVYWTNSAAGTVMMVSIEGGTPVTVASGQVRPGPITGGGGCILWGGEGPAHDGFIAQASPVSGGEPLTLSHGMGVPHALVATETNAYWTSVSGTQGVLTVQTAGGNTSVVAATSSPGGIALGYGGDSLYFGTPTAVMLVDSLASGRNQVSTFASGQAAPYSLADDQQGNVYWSSGGASGGLYGAKSGSSPGEITSGASMAQIALSTTVAYASTLYFTSPGPTPNAGMIMSIPTVGGTPTTLVTGQFSPSGLVKAGNALYWVDTGAGAVMKLTLN